MRLSDRGFTLPELLLAAVILAFTLSGLLLVFINCIILNESNRNVILAFSAVEAKIEEIRASGFTNIFVSGKCPDPRPAGCFCDSDTFNLSGFPDGVPTNATIKISDETTRLKRVRIIACFKVRNRLFGDNINDCQSSPVELVTLIAE